MIMKISRIIFRFLVLRVILCCISVVANAQDDTRGRSELSLLRTAAGVNDCFFFAVPVSVPVTNCEVVVEGYKSGKVWNLDWSSGSEKARLGGGDRQTKSINVC